MTKLTPSQNDTNHSLLNALVLIVVAIITGVIGVVIKGQYDIRVASIPIEATGTAQSVLTQIAATNQDMQATIAAATTEAGGTTLASSIVSQPNPPVTPIPENTLFPKANCIDSNIWRAGNDITHLPDNNKCLDLSDWGLVSNDYSLNLILANNDDTQHHGIYTSLPDGNFDIHFSVIINRMESPHANTAEYMEFGVIDSSKISKGTFLFYKETDPNSPIYLSIGEILFPFHYCGNYSLRGSVQNVILSIKNSELTVLLCPNKTGSSQKIISTNRALWIGWQHYYGGHMVAKISNIEWVMK